MSPNEVLRVISPKFAEFIDKRGWIAVASAFESLPTSAYVDINAGSFNLRLILDRGQYFVEAGGIGGLRYDFVRMLKFFKMVEPLSVENPTLERIDSIELAIEKNISFLSQLFVGDNLANSGFIAFNAKRQNEDIEELRAKAREVRAAREQFGKK